MEPNEKQLDYRLEHPLILIKSKMRNLIIRIENSIIKRGLNFFFIFSPFAALPSVAIDDYNFFFFDNVILWQKSVGLNKEK